MDFITAVSIITKDLEEARTLLDQLSATPGKEIAELELARSRVRSAVEMLALLPKMITSSETEKVVSKVEREVAADDTPEPVTSEVVTEDSKQVMEQTMAGTTDEPERPPVQKKSSEPGKAILADRFTSAGSIGEKMSSVKKDEVITSAMHNKPIDDIGAAIGINDRYYYIRELFSGDTKAFNDAVKRLNGAASLGEAMRILDDSTVMGSDPAAQSSFVDIVRRKFNINV